MGSLERLIKLIAKMMQKKSEEIQVINIRNEEGGITISNKH